MAIGTPLNGGGNPPPGMPTTGGYGFGKFAGQNFSPILGVGFQNYGQYGQQQPQATSAAPQTTQQASAAPASTGGGLNYPDYVPDVARQPIVQGGPSEAQVQELIPDFFRQPYLQGMEAAAATASFASQALPQAGQFQQGLYSATLNPMEQMFMNSSAYLGSLGLEQSLNEIGQEYALDPYNTGKNKAYYDAANQFAAQMMQTGSKLGLDRQTLATQNLPNVFNFPNQAAQYAQQTGAGYYNALETARIGDLKFPYQWASTYPIQGSTYVQPPADSGGK